MKEKKHTNDHAKTERLTKDYPRHEEISNQFDWRFGRHTYLGQDQERGRAKKGFLAKSNGESQDGYSANSWTWELGGYE